MLFHPSTTIVGFSGFLVNVKASENNVKEQKKDLFSSLWEDILYN